MVIRSLIAILVLITTALSLQAQSEPTTFDFIENKGQWDSRIKFRGQLPGGEFYLHNNGFTIAQHNQDELSRLMRHRHGTGEGSTTARSPKQKNERNEPPGGSPDEITLHSHAYRVQFLQANENAVLLPDKVIQTKNNYFIGNDPTKWVSDVKIFQAITYKNVYPNIDVRYYSEYGSLKYDLIIHPGGDISKLALKYDGADKLMVKKNELIIKTSLGDIKELYPYSYQFDNAKGKKEIKCSYVLDRDNTVRFRLENYDRNATLIIDPTLIFSTFSGSTGENWGFTATPGPDGSLFAGGIVFEPGFPTNTGAYQENFRAGGNKGVDMGIIKFSPDGRQRVYATYIGGAGDDLPHSLVADGAGNLIVLGRTYSSNFPTTATREGSGGACDIIVLKLNAAGSALIGSIVIGGAANDGVNIEDQFESGNDQMISLLRNYGDDSHSEVILDNAGNIYVAAQTQSGAGFPIRGTVFQPTPGTDQDGVVMKINASCNTLIWSSFIGGNRDDAAFVLALQPGTQNIYVAGGTFSTNILRAGISGVIATTAVGQADGYVAVISNDGSTMITGSYLGTAAMDIIYGIQFDQNGFPYVMGVSRGSWPVTPGVYSNAGSKQFVSKLRPDLSGYVYSTVFGSGSAQPNISPVAFLVDRCENVYISGWGGWIIPNDPDPYDLSSTVGMPVTPDAIKSTTDGKDFYFIVLKKDAQSLLYGSFFGQSGSYGEHVDGGTSRFDEGGAIYMAICANCFSSQPPSITVPFPTTPGVWGPVNGRGTNGCNLAAVKIAFNFSGVGSGPKPFIGGVQDTVGCVPFNITFRDTVRNAKRYLWNFGDGSPEVASTDFEISHSYTAVGTYVIRLIGIDSSTCNIRDTAYTTIYARDDQALLNMRVTKQDPCESLSYLFENLSAPPPAKPFIPNAFIWDFGDGTRVPSGIGPITHSYATPGPYTVRLIMTDPNYCNSPDSISLPLSVAQLVEAQIRPVDPGCLPYSVTFDNNSLGGQTYRWEFDDGSTSTAMNPTHEFTNVRTYTVKLVVVDSNTCNIIDSTTTLVVVNPIPTANFNNTPVPPTENTPTVFYNLSTGGVRYKWLFGDGDSTIRFTMDTVTHEYNETGNYTACLYTYNQFDCYDSACHTVQTLVRPLMDVPNAFIPSRGGQNSVVVVRGYGIGKMIWRIYNRWGQVVFETNNRKQGWDGTFKGQPQPMDVYAYTLDVEFTDGTKARKTGDITLIR